MSHEYKQLVKANKRFSTTIEKIEKSITEARGSGGSPVEIEKLERQIVVSKQNRLEHALTSGLSNIVKLKGSADILQKKVKNT